MTFSERVYAGAAEAFGKRRGHQQSLSPHSNTWRTVIGRAEHALWRWNDAYGPLNEAQRSYAADLVCYALAHAARNAPNVAQTYAFFHTELTHLLNHERVQAGFLTRASEREDILLDAVLEVVQ